MTKCHITEDLNPWAQICYQSKPKEDKLVKYEVGCLVWPCDVVEVQDNDHIYKKTATSLQPQNTHFYRSAPGDKHTKIGNPAESNSPSQTALFHQYQ